MSELCSVGKCRNSCSSSAHLLFTGCCDSSTDLSVLKLGQRCSTVSGSLMVTGDDVGATTRELSVSAGPRPRLDATLGILPTAASLRRLGCSKNSNSESSLICWYRAVLSVDDCSCAVVGAGLGRGTDGSEMLAPCWWLSEWNNGRVYAGIGGGGSPAWVIPSPKLSRVLFSLSDSMTA